MQATFLQHDGYLGALGYHRNLTRQSSPSWPPLNWGLWRRKRQEMISVRFIRKSRHFKREVDADQGLVVLVDGGVLAGVGAGWRVRGHIETLHSRVVARGAGARTVRHQVAHTACLLAGSPTADSVNGKIVQIDLGLPSSSSHSLVLVPHRLQVSIVLPLSLCFAPESQGQDWRELG